MDCIVVLRCRDCPPRRIFHPDLTTHHRAHLRRWPHHILPWCRKHRRYEYTGTSAPRWCACGCMVNPFPGTPPPGGPVPEPPRHGHGGRRTGAGAPANNGNALKSGRYSGDRDWRQILDALPDDLRAKAVSRERKRRRITPRALQTIKEDNNQPGPVRDNLVPFPNFLRSPSSPPTQSSDGAFVSHLDSLILRLDAYGFRAPDAYVRIHWRRASILDDVLDYLDDRPPVNNPPGVFRDEVHNRISIIRQDAAGKVHLACPDCNWRQHRQPDEQGKESAR